MLSTCLHELFQSDTDWFGSRAFVFLLLFLCNFQTVGKGPYPHVDIYALGLVIPTLHICLHSNIV